MTMCFLFTIITLIPFFINYRTFQPTTGLDLLKVQKVSQEQSWQRTGRAGRDSAGTCYRIFTNEVGLKHSMSFCFCQVLVFLSNC